MVGNPKMDSPPIKTSCGTQNKNSNPMGIGLGIDYACHMGGPHRIRAGGQNQKWPTSGQGFTLAASVVPTASERGDRIRIGPQVGKVATFRGSPPRHQKWPTSGQGGYITPAAWGSPQLKAGGTESEVAHL